MTHTEQVVVVVLVVAATVGRLFYSARGGRLNLKKKQPR
jgi:hypothetical protein